MSDSRAYFDVLSQDCCSTHADVAEGKMMSSPGLKVKGKIFAFYHKSAMGFRLGPQFDPELFGISAWEPLSPFKTKPPLAGWLMVKEQEKKEWENLITLSLEYTRTLA
ncbi:MAG: hypothetical protein NWR72_09860 [Bacteroidia bacterium]|nr:hypothetical protein [Bacteroidia bacterium]